MVARFFMNNPQQKMENELRLAKVELVDAEATQEAMQFRVLYLKAKIARLEAAVAAPLVAKHEASK